jgi:hypothetical protein
MLLIPVVPHLGGSFARVHLRWFCTDYPRAYRKLEAICVSDPRVFRSVELELRSSDQLLEVETRIDRRDR